MKWLEMNNGSGKKWSRKRAKVGRVSEKDRIENKMQVRFGVQHLCDSLENIDCRLCKCLEWMANVGTSFQFCGNQWDSAASASGTACHCHALCIWPLAVVVVVVLSSFWVARPPPKYIILPHRSIRYSFCFEESNTTHKLTKRCKHFIIEVFIFFSNGNKNTTPTTKNKKTTKEEAKKRETTSFQFTDHFVAAAYLVAVQ